MSVHVAKLILLLQYILEATNNKVFKENKDIVVFHDKFDSFRDLIYGILVTYYVLQKNENASPVFFVLN